MNVVGKMNGLMARLFQYEKSIQLLPYNHTIKVNSIVSTKDIPSEVADFKIYVSFANINNNSKVLIMNL